VPEVPEDSILARGGVTLMRSISGFVQFPQEYVDVGVTSDVMVRIVRTFLHVNYQYNRQTIYDVLMHQYRDWERQQNSAGTQCYF